MSETSAPTGLEPESESVLRSIQANGFTGWSSLGLENGRASILQMSGVLGGELEPIRTVEPIMIARPDSSQLETLLYRPADGARMPTLLYLHGGGWALGSHKSVDGVVRRLANRSGCAVLSVNYRLAPEHKYPAALQDVVTALEWVKTEGNAWNLDSTRIGVAGDSSGANLAAAAALQCRRKGILLRFQLLVSPPLDHDYQRKSYQTHSSGHNSAPSRYDVMWFHSLYVNSGGELDDPLVSPLKVENLQALPRTLLIAAEFDPLLDENLLYAQRLSEAGVAVDVQLVRGVFHGFWRMPGLLGKARECIDYAASQTREALTLP